MAGFHILVYGTTADDYVVTDSAYFPVQAINRHKIEFKLTQIKDHTMDTVSDILPLYTLYIDVTRWSAHVEVTQGQCSSPPQ